MSGRSKTWMALAAMATLAGEAVHSWRASFSCCQAYLNALCRYCLGQIMWAFGYDPPQLVQATAGKLRRWQLSSH